MVDARSRRPNQVHDARFGTITTATFGFELDGIEIGRFTSISGLEISVETDPSGTGTSYEPQREYPSKVTTPNLELSRPVDASTNLQRWVQDFARAADGKYQRYTGAVTLYSGSGQRLRSWSFEGAFPTKWSLTDVDAGADGVLMETVTISHDGLLYPDG